MFKRTAVFLMLILCGCSQEVSQTSPKKGMYNSKTETTIQGNVINIDPIPMGSGRGDAIHVLLKTGDGIMQVFLGPDWFLSEQNFSVELGDRLEVSGSKVNLNGQDVLVASKVSKGKQTVILRSEKGVPMWSGSQRRNS